MKRVQPSAKDEKSPGRMKARALLTLSLVLIAAHLSLCRKEKEISFSQEVFPILKKRCVSCHYPGNEFNESMLAMESYESLMKGGVHGSPIVVGQSANSLIIKKVGPNPPFGKQMPLMSKEMLSAEDIELISKWIDQGAKNN